MTGRNPFLDSAGGIAVLFAAEETRRNPFLELGQWVEQYYLAQRRQEGIRSWSSVAGIAILFGAEETGRNPFFEPGHRDGSTIWCRDGLDGRGSGAQRRESTEEGEQEEKEKEKKEEGGLHIRNLAAPTQSG